MNGSKFLLKEDSAKKLLTAAAIIGIIYSLRSLVNMILLTFLFTFIFYNIQKFIFNLLHRFIPILNIKEVTIGIYLAICMLIGFLSYTYIPVIVKQLIIISHQVSRFKIQNYNNLINNSVLRNFENLNLKNYINTSGTKLLESLTDIGQLGMDIFLALILSLVFNLEKDEILKFTKKFETSKLDLVYKFCSYFGRTFLSIFSKIMKLQIITSCVNSILSFLWLSVLGFHQTLGLAFIILILGLIPIAGVLISLIPLCIIAFKLGGIAKIINVLIMIAVLHVIESYILKPKLMSTEIKLPVFFTFVVLIVSEHLMGIWGLLFGVPLFVFLLNLLKVQL